MDETKTPQSAELKSLSSVCLRESGSAGQFDTTHWSVVMVAGKDSSAVAREAMEKLCRTYWYPLYAFIRRRGYEAPEAQDLTQSFFARLLEKDYLSAVDRSTVEEADLRAREALAISQKAWPNQPEKWLGGGK